MFNSIYKSGTIKWSAQTFIQHQTCQNLLGKFCVNIGLPMGRETLLEIIIINIIINIIYIIIYIYIYINLHTFIYVCIYIYRYMCVCV